MTVKRHGPTRGDPNGEGTQDARATQAPKAGLLSSLFFSPQRDDTTLYFPIRGASESSQSLGGPSFHPTTLPLYSVFLPFAEFLLFTGFAVAGGTGELE